MTHEEKADPVVFAVVGEIFKEMGSQFVSWGTLEKIIGKALASAEKKGREDKTPIQWANHLDVAIKEARIEGWNEAIEAAAGILRSQCPDDEGECRCTFVKLSEEINKLKRR